MQLAKQLKKRAQLAYYRYELTTALYMLDFWEKCIFNSLVLLGFILFIYTSINYTPDYILHGVDGVSEYFPAVRPMFDGVRAWIAPPIHVEL
ncbi:hypothetical protein BCR44DRAFT_1501820 [Catenaria anguillulae PL171]|uniref:Uncharacterized protein n=1 Tax=Catenaria anguillulae PL171 TaxID=765915 RepID=A0A1Y2HDL7_9FUNG|nr:hypothetical protein BCR44DRAFT_1501820 [Catenaria anguillulae PL171]